MSQDHKRLVDQYAVSSYACKVCKDVHKEEDLFFIYGNICKGPGGGIVGNNLDDSGLVIDVSIYCRECLETAIENHA